MQPPPARKGPYSKTLKHVHTEQIARLQAKNQHECDLLEDIRNFTKQRSTIEKSYAEALLKLSSAYLNKKIPSIPDLRDEDEEEQWNVWNVWRTVLEENEKLARARLAAVEVFQQQITDDAKNVRQQKLSASKKCLDQLQVVQKEVQVSVGELDRFKKLYFEEEHLAHDARDKVRDVEEKMKKKKGSIFSSFTSLQRSSVKVKQQKFSSKKEACEEKSTGARNDYLINLALANAHSDRYFLVDLDGCIRTMEFDVYEKLKEYLTILGRTELLTCSAAQNSFTKIRDQAQLLSRDYNVTCCVQYYPVLKQHIRYPFDACEGDSCSKITCDHGAGTLLSGEAKKWATRIGKEVKIIKENQKKLVHYLQLKEQGNKTDPDDQNGPDLETKIDEVRETIRRSETEKCKSEAVIECLRDGDVNVDEWLQDIENLTTMHYPGDMARSRSSTSLEAPIRDNLFEKISTTSQSQRETETYYDSDANDAQSEIYRENENSSAEPVERDEDVEAQIEEERKRIEALSATWDDPLKMDWGDSSGAGASSAVEDTEPPMTSPPPTGGTVSSGGGGGHRESWPTDGGSETGLIKCVAIYTYTAQNPDELSIVENEHLELIGEGDGDGWVRARNYKGEEGYVPQNYVEAEQQAMSSSVPGYPLQPQISFSSVDYHVQDPNAVVPPGSMGDNVPGLDTVAEGMEGRQPQDPMQNGYGGTGDEDVAYNHQATVAPEDVNVAAPATSVSSGFTTPFINELRGEGGEFCRALYDYEATGPEELSFYEGQIIRLTRREEDDGWWEGEYDGMKGIFPCIVVEECRWDGEPLSPEGEEEDVIYDEDEEDEDISDSGIAPPSYTPPEIPSHLLPPETKVIVTQPTPTVEHSSPKKEDDARGENEEDIPADEGHHEAEEDGTVEENGFEMEMSGDQQQKYQAQFEEEDGKVEEVTTTAPPPPPAVAISVSDSDMPDVTISISGPEEHEEAAKDAAAGADGLGVVQINILAATPMTDEARTFPGEEEATAEEEPEVPEPPAAPAPPPPVLPQQPVQPQPVSEEGFADFSGFDDNFESSFADSFADSFATCGPPTAAPPPPPVEKSASIDSATAAFEKVAFRRESEPEEEEIPDPRLQDSPEDPMASEPTVIEVIEPKEPYAAPIFSTMGDTKKPDPPQSSRGADGGSLEIDQAGGRKVESGGVGIINESPVTPEELDVQSLAKLESLKESDA